MWTGFFFYRKNYTRKIKSSHASLTPDDTAILEEMKMVADCFGKDVLSQVSKQEFMKNISMIRETVGDRAILRATYFFNENERVHQEKMH